jgi:hypothetical protein
METKERDFGMGAWGNDSKFIPKNSCHRKWGLFFILSKSPAPPSGDCEKLSRTEIAGHSDIGFPHHSANNRLVFQINFTFCHGHAQPAKGSLYCLFVFQVITPSDYVVHS